VSENIASERAGKNEGRLGKKARGTSLLILQIKVNSAPPTVPQ